MFLEILQNSQENIYARVSFLVTLQALFGSSKGFMKALKVFWGTTKGCNFILKETLAQVFSCEFCEIPKNTFFTEHLWATASEYCSKIFTDHGYDNDFIASDDQVTSAVNKFRDYPNIIMLKNEKKKDWSFWSHNLMMFCDVLMMFWKT